MTSHATPDQELPCRDLVEVVTAYLDGALGEVDRRRFEAHLADCEDCVAYVEQIRVTAAGAARSAGRVPPIPAELREGLRSTFHHWVA